MYFKILFVLFVCSQQCIFGSIIGSNFSVSRQNQAAFPAADSDNQMLGFAHFENGFYYEDYLTSCTFDSLFHVSDCANLNGGVWYLQQDVILDSQANLFNPGKISGNFHSMEFVATDSVVTIPSACQPFSFKKLSSVSLGFRPIAADWSFDSSYVGVGNFLTSGQEIRIYHFNGTSLSSTPTVGLEVGKRTISLRWHPTDRFFVVGFFSGAGNDVQVYKHNVSNGTIEAIDGAELSGHVYAVAWHPSGNYLVAGSTNSTKKVAVYAFDKNAGTLTEIDSINLSSNRYPLYSALSFSPDGKYLAVGTIRSGNRAFEVLKFDGSSLTSDVAVDLGNHCYTVDWHPTSSLISVGIAGSSQTHKIYEHNRDTSTLTEKISARTNENRLVFTTHWHKNGKYFMYGNFNGSSSQSKIFLYNSNDCTVKKLTEKNVGNTLTDNRWAPDRKHLSSAAYSTQNLDVFVLDDGIVEFENLALILNSPVELGTDWKFSGESILNLQGSTINLGDYSLQVAPHSCLEIDCAKIVGLKQSNLSCLYEDSSIKLKNCTLIIESDFTFSTGSLIFQDDVTISGSVSLNYTTGQESIINAHTRVLFDGGITFNYFPHVASKTLISLTDKTSFLCFDGSSLVSSRTGLLLTNGNLIFSNFITLSNQAQSFAEGFEFDSTLNVICEADSFVDMHGYVRLD